MSAAERAWAPSSSRLQFSGGWHESDRSRSHESEWWRLRLIRKSRYRKFPAGPAWEGHMWLVRSWLIGLVAAISLLAQGASKAEPVKIRVSWIAPLSNWASLLM